jgi:hypothetical protein
MQRHLAGQFCCVLPLLTRSRSVPRLDEGAVLVAKATRIGDYNHERPLTGPLRPRSEIYLQTARSRAGRFHPKTKEAAGGLHPRGAFRAGHGNRLPAVQFLSVRKLAITRQCPVMSTQVCLRQTPHPQLWLRFGCNYLDSLGGKIRDKYL